jgi:calcineurin-like phosphoesterase family protein
MKSAPGRRRRKASAWSWLVVAASLGALGLGASAAVARAAAKSNHIVAIGDIHGDFDAFVGLLQHARLVDGDRRWIGGEITLVQTGDCVDRGPKVRDVLDLLMALEQQAPSQGGRVVALLGNHESMNAMSNLRDTSPIALAAFADGESEARREAAYAAHVKLAETRAALLAKADPAIEVPKVYQVPERNVWMAAHPPGFVEYLDAFGPEGTYGKWLRAHSVVIRLNDTVFLHGGIDPENAPKKLESLTEQVQKEIGRWDRMRKTMIDQQIALPSFTFEELLQAGRSELQRVASEARRRAGLQDAAGPGQAAQVIQQHPLADLQELDKWATISANGPLWFRGYATWRSDEGAMRLNELQRKYGSAVRFVVGHTMTSGFRVMPRFTARVFLIDTGMLSSYYQGGRASALDIDNGVYTVLTLDGRQVLYDPTATMTR